MKHVIYLSSAVGLFSVLGMRQLLTKCRANNSRLGVTGILLYNFGNFFQILEGDDDKVTMVYQKICHDPRHQGIIQLFNEPVEKKSFPDWSIGFWDVNSRIIPTPDEVDLNFSSKKSLLEQFEFSPQIHSFVKTFIR